MILNTKVKQRLLYSIGADGLGQFLNFGIRLLLVPLFLSSWGVNTYGEWLILTAIGGWLSLGDLGGQLYYVNRLTEEWVSNKLQSFQKTYSTGIFVFFILATSLFLITLFILLYLPIENLFRFESIDKNSVILVVLLIAFKFVFSLPLGLILGVYRSIGKQAISVMYTNLMLVIQFVLSVIALQKKCSVIFLASIEIIPYFIIFPIILFDLKSKLSNDFNFFSFKEVQTSIIKESIYPSLHFLTIQFSSALFIQGSVLVIASTLGPIQVALYSSLRVIANVMSKGLSILSHSAWPELTRYVTQHKNIELNNLFNTILRLTLISGVVYIILTSFFGDIFFQFWVQDNMKYNKWSMFLLSAQVIINLIWTWAGNLLMSINSHRDYAILQLPLNILGLIFCFFGAYFFNLNASIFGLIIGQSVPMIFLIANILQKHNFHEIKRHVLINGMNLLIVLIIIALFMFYYG